MGKYNANEHTKEENDNHADQMNPNNETYWTDRGYEDRPDDWEEKMAQD